MVCELASRLPLTVNTLSPVDVPVKFKVLPALLLVVPFTARMLRLEERLVYCVMSAAKLLISV